MASFLDLSHKWDLESILFLDNASIKPFRVGRKELYDNSELGSVCRIVWVCECTAKAVPFIGICDMFWRGSQRYQAQQIYEQEGYFCVIWPLVCLEIC